MSHVTSHRNDNYNLSIDFDSTIHSNESSSAAAPLLHTIIHPKSFSSSHHHKQQQQQQQQQHLQQQHPRLKCVVLGATGCGKTTFLRRLVHGTFSLYTQQTQWCDVYSTKYKISNNYYTENDDDSIIKNNRSRGDEIDTNIKKIIHASPSSQSMNSSINRKQQQRRPHHDKKRKKKKSSKSPKRKKLSKLKSHSSSYDDRSSCATTSSVGDASVNLQMWDTVGFPSPPETTSNYTSKRLTNNMEMEYTSTLNSFNQTLGTMDAAMLMYDASSNSSFLQLIQWYSQWTQEVDRIEHYSFRHHQDSTSRNNHHDNFSGINHSSQFKKTAATSFPPLLVVANKTDKFLELQARKNAQKVPQRDILGLKGLNYQGKEFHYEYKRMTSTFTTCTQHHEVYRHVSFPTPTINTSTGTILHGDTTPIKPSKKNIPSSPSSNYTSMSYNNLHNQHPIHNINTTPSKLKSIPHQHEWERWICNTAYINAVRKAEEQCIPDHDLILIWCESHHLPHVEVSSLDGSGMDHAMDLLTTMALEHKLRMQIMNR